MSATHYLAVDLGAESGRVLLGTLQDQCLVLEDIHRFPNRVVAAGKSLLWDVAFLETEIFTGLDKAAERDVPITGISTNSWGVDYVLLDGKGQILSPVYCYRDARTAGSQSRLFEQVPFAEIYAETGIQYMVINTIYQFEAQQQEDPQVLAKSNRFLNLADYFNARFGGLGVAEVSLASTTQLFNPRTGAWSKNLISALGVNPSLFPPIVASGTVLGPVVGQLKNYATFAQANVVATCSHDTGAAVAAVPATGDDWVYLSSGTWSLLGVELPCPILTDAAREAGFTNEVGLGGTIRFLKNIAGLWVLQECRRAWESAGQPFTYERLIEQAIEVGPATAYISFEDSRFLAPGDMPEKISAFCRETGQSVLTYPGEFVRVILESLALTYGQTLRQLEKLVGRNFKNLNIVSGGSRNQLLNQLTADATGLLVTAGPVEATAIGNILIQAMALGHVKTHKDLRRVVQQSFSTQSFIPGYGFSDAVRFRFREIQKKKS